jgi:hypothetical protein
MVIRIIVEGGALPDKNSTADAGTVNTYDGSEVLREELKKFFIKVLGISDISIIVTYEGSNKNAAKVFISQPDEDYLYTDLDDVPEKRDEWFSKMENDGIVIPEERQNDVFFWIQEMEAWFLKQPQCIEAWATVRKIEIKTPIASDPLIAGKDIEHLVHKPSEVMKVIFRRDLKNTKKGKDGKPQKIVYGKLRVAPRLIPYLNPQELKEQDKELQLFVDSVNRKVDAMEIKK